MATLTVYISGATITENFATTTEAEVEAYRIMLRGYNYDNSGTLTYYPPTQILKVEIT